ncbi:Glycosyltransferase, catalytic subunit of cellulose synthase and poly-beta-1,6-N-acetylglucosamine synthase [Pedobacter steynii]|uniref:Glycosyltransferase, catalytic subunit of cellulose synthase and poly-beta-1,6-N-acetylglucosamine synthase n=1 Tax=Pedobacter steynii TaxID=430522 RepID=A0A1G9Z133_9SPHI|nr:glycosyltransferase [Pedobacter steynii]NQX39888.1 glycosyltransferase [Pedobacter steynii]SDN14336.1 Glycosyltransferase, catalytic subunit of cellulose synthase and poly-beta-1,6-N-acetylglucosamine synthase [Pedobacter steynii]
MFFSIIIPLYNRPQEIDELLKTLTHQTYTQFEVLVIEDGSTNDAKAIVQKYEQLLDVKYFFKPNEGQGFARNYGFERAKGDYFVIFDSDCLIPEDYLEIVKNYLFEHHLDAYGGPDAAHQSFTPVQKAISYAMTSPFTTGGIRGNKKHIGQFHPRSFNMGVSREVYEKVGGFILTRLGEDIEYSIRIHENGFKIGLIPAAKVFHKRRTSFSQFYKQLHFFGRARINIYKHFPSELKLVHFFPAAFTCFVLFSVFMNILWPALAYICDFILLVYFVMIFFHSWQVNKSVKVAFFSIIASFIQLTAYGLGFMQDFFKRVVFKQQ